MIAIVTKFARADGHALKWKIKKKKRREGPWMKTKKGNNGPKEERNDPFLCAREYRSF